ncbi:hypothetical protein SAMD00019534_118050 [Acytostelium subglobosum LB1]|uniref:hypothetical protein n=1 Tax=Acytostelium subglobosum LB1 TaxID=1410327 RepID=UPI000644834E|nr:hypothetical protein SAMD00019534_118050 [Acytostelium subglobosum LB1]GAM28629.1 hypothetical protein SAMD00019534_118050 [Acytostelium subglobosum LB1]|eukprot:XP_012748407.1 hypothetical protein SAMD00019534_118050 [Acytostelium subglobosum LB1]
MQSYFRYITDKGIANLEHYSYSGVDNSFCAKHFLKHWWNFGVERLTPIWLAPNLITLFGLFCNIGMYLIAYFMFPTLTEAAPRWPYFIIALLIFAYQTLDNIDGKQARRTKSSSPLGELFDHCCDALSVAMFAIVMSGTIRVGPIWAFVSCIIGFWPFYLAHWEEYHAGILVLGEFNGPTEAQVLFIIIELITGIFTSDIWTVGPTNFTLGNILIILMALAAIYSIYTNVHNTFKLPNRMPFTKCLMQLTPFTIFFVLIIIWASTSAMLESQPHLFIMTIGIIFGYLQSRFITQRVCHDDCKMFYPILIPLALCVFNSILIRGGVHSISELPLLWCMFALACVQFLLFAYFTTHQLCDHLKIKVFTIPYYSQQPTSPGAEVSASLLNAIEEGQVEHVDDDDKI